MPTLSEYAKLEIDPMVSGIFTNIVTANGLMAFLEFDTMEGNSLKYNRENALPASATHQTGDTWEDTEATYTQKTTALTTVGVQSPLDRYALQTRGSQNSQEAVLFTGMAKSLARKIEQLVIIGDPGSVSTEWEGLTSLLIADDRWLMMDDGTLLGVSSAVAGDETELTLPRLDTLIDLIEPNSDPTVLMMNKTMRRKLTALSRAAGSGVLMDTIELFGRQVVRYNGIPIVINDFITSAEQYENSGAWGSSTATSIFALKFGKDNEGYSVMHNGPVMTPEIQRLGIKEKKNENLYRMVVYIGAALWSKFSVAGLAGIDSQA